MSHLRLIIFILLAITACTNQTMTFKESEQFLLDNIPSGSGISKANNQYYIIGDDSPYLFVCNTKFDIVKKIAIADTAGLSNGRISKPKKADLEAMEIINERELIIFGSGSKSPQRDSFIRILLEEEVKVESYNLTKFYEYLKSLKIFTGSELNIEATAYKDGILYLFNRKRNIVVSLKYTQLIAYAKGGNSLPAVETKRYVLPQINTIEAGFSGAVTLNKEPKIMFTASVEDTNNAYDDGAILGSFIGILDITNNTIEYCKIPEIKEKLKVESIAIDEEISSNKTKVILITDNDKGKSRIIKGDVIQ